MSMVTDERERIAQVIEEREGDISPLHPSRETVLAAYRVAARIARNGGADERAL